MKKILLLIAILMTIVTGAKADNNVVASVTINGVTTEYQSFYDAWNAVNVSGTTSYLYLLKNVNICQSLSPTTGANISLDADEGVTLTHNGTEAMFKVDALKSEGTVTEGLTINGGIYQSNCNVVEVNNTFPITINNGEFTTTGSGKFDIYCESVGNCWLNGGKYNYNYTTDPMGGIHVKSGWTVGASLPKGKAFYQISSSNPNPLSYTTVNVQELKRPVYIADCKHDLEEGVCTYCGKSDFVNVAKIGESYYIQLKTAFDNAADGQTVELLTDYTLIAGDYINVTKNVTFDLGAYSLSGNKASDSNGVAGLLHMGTAGKTLNITGTTGTITNNNANGAAVSLNKGNVNTGTGYYLSSLATTGNVTLSSGKYNNLKVKAGKTTVSQSDDSDIRIESQSVEGGTLSIIAGKFDFDPEEYTVATSKIDKNNNTWTVSKDKIVAHVTIGSTITRYESVYDAIKAANNAHYNGHAATVTIVKDCTESSGLGYFDNSYGVTIDLDSHTFNTNANFNINTYGKLTIKNGTLNNSNNNPFYNYSIYVGDGCELVIENVKINASDSKNDAIVLSSGSPKFYIKDSEVIGSSQSNMHAINIGGASNCVHIYDGTFKSGDGLSSAIVWSSGKATEFLSIGYDFFNASGNAINSDVESISSPVVVVKPAESFTVNNLKYKVTQVAGGEQKDQYTVACAGYNGDMPANTSINFPERVTDSNNPNSEFVVDSIAASAFNKKTNLTAITLSNTIKGIGRYAFEGTSLAEVNIPENMVWIDKEAFRDIQTLRTINYNAKNAGQIDYDLTEYNPTIGFYKPFDGSDKYVTAINIGANVESIPDGMFYGLGDNSNQTCVITANAATAPTIKTNTFSAEAKALATITLRTPNNIDDSYKAWGFSNYKPEILYLTDAYPAFIDGTYAAGKVAYTRKGLTSGKYGSVTVPFNFDITSDCGIEHAYQPIGISLFDEDETLNVYFDELTTVTAGTPVLVKLNADNISILNKNETTLSSTMTCTETTNVVYKKTGDGQIVAKDNSKSVKFGGTYVQLTSTEKPGLQVFDNNGCFYPSEAVNPFRAYFVTNAWTGNEAKGIVINAIFGDDDVTGISMILSQDGELSPVSGKIYDTNGRYVGTDIKSLPKGMYIINNKKVIK